MSHERKETRGAKRCERESDETEHETNKRQKTAQCSLCYSEHRELKRFLGNVMLCVSPCYDKVKSDPVLSQTIPTALDRALERDAEYRHCLTCGTPAHGRTKNEHTLMVKLAGDYVICGHCFNAAHRYRGIGTALLSAFGGTNLNYKGHMFSELNLQDDVISAHWLVQWWHTCPICQKVVDLSRFANCYDARNFMLRHIRACRRCQYCNKTYDVKVANDATLETWWSESEKHERFHIQDRIQNIMHGPTQ